MIETIIIAHYLSNTSIFRNNPSSPQILYLLYSAADIFKELVEAFLLNDVQSGAED